MADANSIEKNRWFRGADSYFMDIATILVHLSEKGLLDKDMISAISIHAMNMRSSLPNQIGAISKAIGAAHAGFGLLDKHALSANWGLSSLAYCLDANDFLCAEIGDQS